MTSGLKVLQINVNSIACWHKKLDEKWNTYSFDILLVRKRDTKCLISLLVKLVVTLSSFDNDGTYENLAVLNMKT